MNPDNCFSKRVTLTAKGIAVFLMLFHHLFYDAPGFVDRYAVSARPLSWPALNSLSFYGKICVSVFVFLTGYGMTINLSSRSSLQRQQYAVSRFLKLECGFLFIFLLTLLSSVLQPSRLAAYFTEGHAKGILLILIDAAGLANFFGTPTFNGTWWYMSFAIFLIFLMPAAVRLHEQFGICVVALAALVTDFGIDSSRAFPLYLFSLSLGIWTAQSGTAGRIRTRCKTTASRWGCLALSCACFLIFSAIRIKWGFYPWTGGLICMSLLIFLFILVDLMHVRLRLMELLGKYSMTIFLTHTLIYNHYFSDFIYSPKNWFLILLLLTAVSLACAVILEALRKLVRWDRLPVWHVRFPHTDDAVRN